MTTAILSPSPFTKPLCACAALLMLSACGGSSTNEPDPIISFVVSATAGVGGTIAPGTVSVDNGQTTSFTVSANEGYAISSVTGCGGSLTGSTYTTAAITATCTVTASFSAVSSAEVLTGIFVDSAVENISFSTPSQQGQTSHDGEFNYLAGETVTFALGDLLFPPTAAKAVLTPIDILGAGQVDDDAVINMVRLLLSLDQDGDASNGIQLTDAAAAVASAAIDFTVSLADFAANTAVQTLLSNGGQDSPVTELVSVEAALAHFNTTLAEQGIQLPSIVGAFVEVSRAEDEDQSDAVILVFLADGSYYLVEINNELSGNDFEYGSYHYQLRMLSADAIIDENTALGLNGDEAVLLQLTETGLELMPADVSSPYVFERVESESNSLIGGWLLAEESVVVVFADDGTFTAMQPFDADGGVGFEWGTYSYDAQTELISFIINIDTSGETLFSAEAPQSAVVEADTLTLRFSAEDVVELSRIK